MVIARVTKVLQACFTRVTRVLCLQRWKFVDSCFCKDEELKTSFYGSDQEGNFPLFNQVLLIIYYMCKK